MDENEGIRDLRLAVRDLQGDEGTYGVTPAVDPFSEMMTAMGRQMEMAISVPSVLPAPSPILLAETLPPRGDELGLESDEDDWIPTTPEPENLEPRTDPKRPHMLPGPEDIPSLTWFDPTDFSGGGIPVYNSSTSEFEPVAAGSASQVLTMNGGGTAPEWADPSGMDGLVDAFTHTIKINTGIPAAGSTQYTIYATDLRGKYIRVEMAYLINASADGGWTAYDYGGNTHYRKWHIEAAPGADVGMGAATNVDLMIDKDDGYLKWEWTSHGTIRWCSCRVLVYNTVPDYEAT